jgi:hypothetical protein
VLPIVAKSWGIPPLLVGLAAICVLAALLTHRFRIETTGQSLEAVQSWERSQAALQSAQSRNLSPQGD